jgi:hypothetical protein
MTTPALSLHTAPTSIVGAERNYNGSSYAQLIFPVSSPPDLANSNGRGAGIKCLQFFVFLGFFFFLLFLCLICFTIIFILENLFLIFISLLSFI